jgi:hypothetical protein
MIKSARSAGSASELDKAHRHGSQRSVRRILDVKKRERGCAHMGSRALTSQSFVACWSNEIFMFALRLCPTRVCSWRGAETREERERRDDVSVGA